MVFLGVVVVTPILGYQSSGAVRVCNSYSELAHFLVAARAVSSLGHHLA